jgi:hypothetical protein
MEAAQVVKDGCVAFELAEIVCASHEEYKIWPPRWCLKDAPETFSNHATYIFESHRIQICHHLSSSASTVPTNSNFDRSRILQASMYCIRKCASVRLILSAVRAKTRC